MPAHRNHRRILFLSQVYPPDPAAGGQLIASAAVELVRRGHEVRVLTVARGYDNPSAQYPWKEVMEGVGVTRLAFASFGKKSSWARLLGGIGYIVQSIVRGLLMSEVETVIVSSHPPIAPLAGWVIARLKRARLVYWIMDLNPDQAVALGHFKSGSLVVKAMNWMQRTVLKSAHQVIVLDRFMEARVRAKSSEIRSLSVIPPWPLRRTNTAVPREANAFRTRHEFRDRIVIMYSGNHGPSHPLDTLIAAASRLRDDPRFFFAFVGGGIEKQKVERIHGSSVVSLPYQPFAELSQSLGAADVHVVTMGDAVVGMNHPSKLYDALAARRPIIFIGPKNCHIADLFENHDLGWHVTHGDVDGLLRVLEEVAELLPHELVEAGNRAELVLDSAFRSPRAQLCDLIERS